ncbi:nucleotidyltransferase family protein [Billgrantia bachuensis]|uniref:Nucleotidyltransferase family protein n=1 Tax=Billgrantia bachuensis TaxID=2717286 RepID=A0ABX0PTD7_9GAMM|nr:nucleotidyltransferase family protein [Halomonas bachuensis]NIC06650.1 nucleotidyltransferase family protein [Halomonas bachuensis]
MHSESIVAVVLAAGLSRRFGKQDKRIAQLPDGRGILAATVSRAGEAFPVLRVVLREEDDRNALGLLSTTPIIRATRAEHGLGASLGEAITAIGRDTSLAGIEAAAILLGDMPRIGLETLLTLRRQAGRSRIVRPCHMGKAGHPVLFGREFWPALETLDGDDGAKKVLHHHRARLITCSVEDPGVCLDIDRQEDLIEDKI